MEKHPIKALHEKIELLNDAFAIKEVELSLLENDLIDNLRSNILLSKLTQYSLQMLMELNEHERKNKATERSIKAKKRLLDIMSISVELSGMGDKLQSLKLINQQMVGKMQVLRLQNDDLRKEVEKLTLSHEYNPQ